MALRASIRTALYVEMFSSKRMAALAVSLSGLIRRWTFSGQNIEPVCRGY